MSSCIGARSVAPALFLVPPMLLGGCASIVGSAAQPVEVTAVCEGRVLANSHCTLTNDKGRWSVTTPGHTLIHKSYENLLVQCQNDKNTGHATFVSKNNGGAWGNILAGGLIGYAVDAGGGAGFDYPQAVTVVLNPPCPQGEQK
jgi:hypothetical protein